MTTPTVNQANKVCMSSKPDYHGPHHINLQVWAQLITQWFVLSVSGARGGLQDWQLFVIVKQLKTLAEQLM